MTVLSALCKNQTTPGKIKAAQIILSPKDSQSNVKLICFPIFWKKNWLNELVTSSVLIKPIYMPHWKA